ncbi:MAG: Y-family DNA polymerase [Rhodospirillaceae bacterium]|nr:Y-family DNA polymerase [Rhodospirillaceae bacterium]
MGGVFALVDCNNFFVSCERVFAPELEGQPVVVLSNNDGCIIARSNEAKALDIAMGAPLFKNRDVIRRHHVRVYSSNYALYGDMSARVMSVLAAFTPEVEVYSIDEAFLELSGFERRGLEHHGHDIRETVRRWTGLPVSVGIGASKTLAKAATETAKKDLRTGGVLAIEDEVTRLRVLAGLDIGDIWGIGRRWAQMLKSHGIYTALDFANQPEPWVRKRMGVGGARTQLELRGIPCLDMDCQPADKKTLRVSRSFAKPVRARQDLSESVAAFAARAAEKLRQGGLVAAAVSVFIRTNRFRTDGSFYRGETAVALPGPSSHTNHITRAALAALARIYKPGLDYKQAGVMLLDLAPRAQAQSSLFAQPDKKTEQRSDSLMAALDGINTRMGRDALRYGAAGVVKSANGKPQGGVYTVQNSRSPRYTTNWRELPVVR